MVLVIKHAFIEGPGHLGYFLAHQGWVLKTIELELGDKLPDNFYNIEAIISLGGPMNVYEEKKYSFLKEEGEFVRKALDHNLPFLGICLGAQILAKATNARVRKAAQKEIGWHKIQLTQDAGEDLLFSTLPMSLDCFQWHEDTFDIPEGAALLAISDTCRNQAFRVGQNAYGMQFHLEVDERLVTDWSRDFQDKETVQKIRSFYREHTQVLLGQAQGLCMNFDNIIRQHSRMKN